MIRREAQSGLISAVADSRPKAGVAREAFLWAAALGNVLCQGGFGLLLRGGDEGGSGFQLVVVYSIALLSVVIIGTTVVSRGLAPRVWALLAVFALPLLLIPVWHEPYQQFRFAVALVSSTFCGLAISLMFGSDEILDIIVRAATISMVCSLAMVVLRPSLGTHTFDDVLADVHAGAWRGIYSHKNEFGQASDIAFLSVLVIGQSRFRVQTVFYGLLALSVGNLVMSRSSAALLLPFIAIFLSIALWNGPRPRIVHLTRFPALVTLCFIPFLLPFVSLVLDLVGRDLTFTGRTLLWSYLLDNYGQFQFLGHGPAFYGVDLYVGIAAEMGGSYTDPHNGYLDLYLSYGVFGCMVFATSLLAVIWVVRSNMAQKDTGTLVLARVTLVCCFNYLASASIESTLVRGLYPASAMVFLLISASVVRSAHLAKRELKQSTGRLVATRRMRFGPRVGPVC